MGNTAEGAWKAGRIGKGLLHRNFPGFINLRQGRRFVTPYFQVCKMNGESNTSALLRTLLRIWFRERVEFFHSSVLFLIILTAVHLPKGLLNPAI